MNLSEEEALFRRWHATLLIVGSLVLLYGSIYWLNLPAVRICLAPCQQEWG